MIESLEKRAAKAGLSDRIKTRVCSENSFEIDSFNGKIDFALAFAVVHEVADPPVLFAQVHSALKSEGKLLIAEPKGISKKSFATSIQTAKKSGFEIIDNLHICGIRAVLLKKIVRHKGIIKSFL